jgi:hypothetical protein
VSLVAALPFIGLMMIGILIAGCRGGRDRGRSVDHAMLDRMRQKGLTHRVMQGNRRATPARGPVRSEPVQTGPEPNRLPAEESVGG